MQLVRRANLLVRSPMFGVEFLVEYGIHSARHHEGGLDSSPVLRLSYLGLGFESLAVDGISQYRANKRQMWFLPSA